jgi:CubicO group peptidase (beta-lactamase class C family)
MLMTTDVYVPAADRSGWERAAASDTGFDAQKLEAAGAFAGAHESRWPRSLYHPDGRYVGTVEWNEKGPWGEIVGPVIPRGGPAGLILAGGRIAAEWGDTTRADMTFSIAKSYLAILAGIACDDGLIGLDDPVARTVDDPLFASAQNAPITWRHLLQQSSEWQGELFEKSDQVDHNRRSGPGADNSRKGELRVLQAPGTFYEYNDVRVNVLSYALMCRFGRALPEVLKERVMDLIGASQDWAWHGYRNSWVELGGRRMQSVPGGSHWGGGLFISALDHARVGLLIARKGRWGDRRILSERYIDAMLSPSPTNCDYGLLWWLNRDGTRYPSAPKTSVCAVGAGSNVIWIDPEHDLVAVLRWIDPTAVDGFLARVLAARR